MLRLTVIVGVHHGWRHNKTSLFSTIFLSFYLVWGLMLFSAIKHFSIFAFLSLSNSFIHLINLEESAGTFEENVKRLADGRSKRNSVTFSFPFLAELSSKKHIR